MLRIRPLLGPSDHPWEVILPGGMAGGLHEDNDYLLEVAYPDTKIFVDDVELQPEGSTLFGWRPAFYAGRVVAEIVHSDARSERYLLDVCPSISKSGQNEFDAMVDEIRAFDQSLLSGVSSAKMAFGREGCSGRYELDVLLSRIREHGPEFLDAMEAIVRSPHRFLVADTRILPLSRVRRLHHTALRDHRLAAIATGHALLTESIDSFQVSGSTSAPTFDTPANRTLKGLLKRFRAAVVLLRDAVQRVELGSPREEQLLRCERRLCDLDDLETRAHQFLLGPLFREVTSAEPSSAGLTQIAAQPNYSKSYRLGYRALATQIKGNDADDKLHVPPSWGIYETWCFLCVVSCTKQIIGGLPVEHQARAAAAERAVRFDLSNDEWIEVLFQATFPSLKATANRLAWTLSGERRPDIVLVHHCGSGTRAMILDAKWRSGRSNVLDAMHSVHIYHDALRIGAAKPRPCAILLPGYSSVPELETDEFIQTHEVGGVSSVRISAPGIDRVGELIRGWLES
jgi:hypothetical protein